MTKLAITMDNKLQVKRPVWIIEDFNFYFRGGYRISGGDATAITSNGERALYKVEQRDPWGVWHLDHGFRTVREAFLYYDNLESELFYEP